MQNTILFLAFVIISWPPVVGDFLEWFASVFADKFQPLSSPADDEIFQESLLDVKQVCKKYGYPMEHHNATTKDGYILSLHRIPHGKNKRKSEGYPVLLMHGILASSNFWVDNVEQSLTFFLADNGYDVWLGNFRGNFETSNKKYNRSQKQFWDFSWEEMADIDTPAMVNYILEKTVKTKLIYIGHSMGSTVGFAFLSANPNYHNKIAGFVALSPIPGLYYSPTTLRIVMPYGQILASAFSMMGINNVMTIPHELHKVQQHFCPVIDTSLCGLGMDASGGFDPYLRNNTRNFIYINHAAAGVSTKTLNHFAQMYTRKGMYRFDYGWLKNLAIYGSLRSPAYDLKEISVPVGLIYGANDALANLIDITLLSRKLPNIIGTKIVDFLMFAHLDIGYAMNAKQLYYNDLLSYLRKM